MTASTRTRGAGGPRGRDEAGQHPVVALGLRHQPLLGRLIVGPLAGQLVDDERERLPGDVGRRVGEPPSPLVIGAVRLLDLAAAVRQQQARQAVARVMFGWLGRLQVDPAAPGGRAGTAPAGKVTAPTLGEGAQHALVGAVLGPEPHRRLDVVISRPG